MFSLFNKLGLKFIIYFDRSCYEDSGKEEVLPNFRAEKEGTSGLESILNNNALSTELQ